ncbi:MAG: lmo0937 family membrane protein [Acidobacteriaceae bacterium]
MLWTIVAILLILWLLGFTVWHVGALIHILLVIALVIIVINLVSGRRRVV